MMTLPFRSSFHGLVAVGFFALSIVPVLPQSEASAQVAAAVKKSASRAAASQAARRAATQPAQAARRSSQACRAIANKCHGIARENAAQRLLGERFPSDRVQPETYLRNRNGKLARDPVSGKARRIDFVVFSRGAAVKRFEITSQFASKRQQLAREWRILTRRKNGQPRTGPAYVRDRQTGKLVPVDKRLSDVWRLK